MEIHRFLWGAKGKLRSFLIGSVKTYYAQQAVPRLVCSDFNAILNDNPKSKILRRCGLCKDLDHCGFLSIKDISLIIV